jgi:hypothetical protein
MNQVVECANCDGGGSDLQFWLTATALVIAFAALAMNYIQFREFMREARAKAEFNIRLGSPGAEEVARDADLQFVEGGHGRVRVRLDIRNVGDRSASETLINVGAPPMTRNLRWCGPEGEKVVVTDPHFEPDTPVRVQGVELHSVWLSKVLPRFGRKRSIVLYFEFDVDVPEGGFGFFIGARVYAEETPGQTEYAKLHMIILGRGEERSS